MKVTAITTIHHNGEVFSPGEEVTVDKAIAEYLEKEGAIAPLGKEAKKDEVVIDAKELYETTEDFKTLTVKELKAVCALLNLSTDGNKDALVATIEETLGEEE